MTVTLMSFGFNKGAPEKFDVLFDARGIYNPGKNQEKDGRDKEIQDLIIKNDVKAKAMIRAVVGIAKEHPSAKIAIGCRFGKHRSVALVERIAKGLTAFSDNEGHKINVDVYHLDLDDEYADQQEYEEKVLAHES
jgi:UPF0042 nucleotide-binding protein